MKAELIKFEKINNTRDLGSLINKDGRKIKSHKLIRSGALFNASNSDKKLLQDLVDTIIDFRTEVEREEKPDPIIEGIKIIPIEVMGNKSTGITKEKGFQASLIDLMRNADTCKLFMINLYKGFLEKSCLEGYRKFFNILLDDHPKGILFHCTAGKDRTGFAAILIEYILGVSKEDILEDYMYTAITNKEETEYLTNYYINEIKDNPNEVRKAVEYAFSPQKEYLDILEKEIIKKYKDIDIFLEKELGLNKEKISLLRDLYLE